MNQEEINEVMWASLPEWRKQQLLAERENNCNMNSPKNEHKPDIKRSNR